MPIAISLAVMIIGAVVYLVCTAIGKYAEMAELGRLAFFAGLLAWLLK